MVDPADVEKILSDAARLMKDGEIVVFGSAALAFWLDKPPASRDVDIWCKPPERGDVILALMGEESWYHRKHHAYVEVWGPETFCAPYTWRTRSTWKTHADHPGVRMVIPHPHDILMSKIERGDGQDWEHARRILTQIPLNAAELDQLANEMPHRTDQIDDPERLARFEANLRSLRERFGL